MNEFKKTKIRLTFLYFCIIFAIVIFFSVITFQVENSQFGRFEDLKERLQTTQMPPDLPASIAQVLQQRNNDRITELDKSISEARFSIILNIAILDFLILGLSGVGAYLLAKKTLAPIEQSYERQKTFVGDASHEFKTPLTSMKMETELILRSKHVENSEYKDYAESMLEEINFLTNLTNNLLDLAKYDNKRLSLNAEKVDLKEIVDKCTSKLSKVADKKKVVLKQEYLSENNFIFADKNRIEQLICIFMDNAIKYNKENGSVDISLSDANNGHILLSVKDTGIGIPTEHLNKVFDRFYRVSEDRNLKGAGLGLSIAKQIIEESIAKIQIQSFVDKGTEIYVWFPKFS